MVTIQQKQYSNYKTYLYVSLFWIILYINERCHGKLGHNLYFIHMVFTCAFACVQIQEPNYKKCNNAKVFLPGVTKTPQHQLRDSPIRHLETVSVFPLLLMQIIVLRQSGPEVLGQNGRGQNGKDKMVRTKWYR